jgi:tRNA(Ile2)-agmatinylcytidine synthase
MTWIGIDDTDSPTGGCTTHVLTEVIRVAREAGFELIGYPRLVRLNPNAPGRTRGNAALAARFGRGRGRPRRLGEIGGAPLHAFPRGAPLSMSAGATLVELAWRTVLVESRTEPGTDPALVATRRLLPTSLYWEAVRNQLDRGKVEGLLRKEGALVRTAGSGEGIVGAAAALSWRGAHPTWELIAYRGTLAKGARLPIPVARMERTERRFPELFQCQDARTRRILVSPHTACPILLGLRATRPDHLPEALPLVAVEPVDRWVIFESNQGTGDHLSDLALGELRPYGSARLSGEIVDRPESVRGGHWKFRLREPQSHQEVECVAFEPTKTLPRLVRELRPGDRVRVWGGIAEEPPFRLEGIEVRRLAVRTSSAPNPRCPECGARARSLGAARGFRCIRCRRRLPLEVRGKGARENGPTLGTYHPTPSSRRHLAPRAPESPDGRSTPIRLPRRARSDLYR